MTKEIKEAPIAQTPQTTQAPVEKKEIKFFFKKDGKEEEIQIERWVWVAVYEDKTELHQFNIDGTFHQLGEIDWKRVKMFVMYKPMPQPFYKRVDLVIPKDAKVIHKYRHYALNVGTPEERKYKIYIFGYKLKGGQAHYNYIMPNDIIIQSENDNLPLTEFGLK